MRFLGLHVCDVLQFRDDRARMCINSLLASFGAFEREKNRVYFKLLSIREHCDTLLEMKI